MRCAIIEFNYYHGETLPSLVYVLNRLGASVDVYCHPQVLANDPFIYTTGLRYNRFSLHDWRFRFWTKRLAFRQYDLVIVNSVEPKSILEWIRRIPVPLLAVLHNAELLERDQDYSQFFARRNRRPLVLAKHIAKLAHSNGPSLPWFAPVYLGEPCRRTNGDSRIVRFCIQGNVQFCRRNYASALEAAGSLVNEGVSNFRIDILGRSFADGATLRNQIASNRLDQFFSFSDGELCYREFYGNVQSSRFLLPLVDGTSTEFEPYFRHKMTTSMQNAIAFGVVPIATRQLAELYEVTEQSVCYEDGGLADALRTAMRLNGDEEKLTGMHAQLGERREQLLSESVQNMASVWREMGL